MSLSYLTFLLSVGYLRFRQVISGANRDDENNDKKNVSSHSALSDVQKLMQPK